MKRILGVFCSLIIMGTATRADASSECETVAKNFLSYLQSSKGVLSSHPLEANELAPDEPPVHTGCLVTLEGGGYILVSGSHKLTPIKGYSLKGDFETLPDAYKKYILNEMEHNARTAESTGRTVQSIGENEKRWDFLLNYPAVRTPLVYVPDTFLLSTTWKQGFPYNKFLPEVNGQKVVAGCINIALAQVLKYHEYPEAGKGVVSYSWNGQQLKSILYRPFNWGNMPDSLTGAEPEHQIDEVARLIRDLGIMNQTAFSLTSSATSTNVPRLIHSLAYSNTISEMDNADVTLFFNTLRSEIDAERPALLSFPGHMTVADGYKGDDPTGRMIHVNMGWGGHADDYYALDQTVVAGSYTFSPDLDIIYGIKPCSGADCAANLEANDHVDGAQISGKFDFFYDMDEYYVYLKGNTTITGNRGLYNPDEPDNFYFYMTLYDSSNQVVASNKLASAFSSLSLAPGKYRLKASLRNEKGGGFPLDAYNSYTISFTTGAMDGSEKAAADAASEVPPVIYNDLRTVLLNSSTLSPLQVLIDARDENGDPLAMQIADSNPSTVQATLQGNILSIAPGPVASGTAGTVKVRATANGESSEKTFVVMATDQDVGFGKTYQVNGVFESPSDLNTHAVILEGGCTIYGYRGFSNQAFYTSVKDEAGNTVVGPAASTINHHFPRGLYYISAYLGGYSLNPGTNDRYVLTVTCPDADDSVATIASLLNVDLSGTAFLAADINADGNVDLADAVMSLQVLSQRPPSGIRLDYGWSGVDVDGDGKIGLQETDYILQKVSLGR